MAKKLNTDTSIVDYLKSQGIDSSYNNRKKIAGEYGIQDYSGTSSQNVNLLGQLKTGNKPKTQEQVKVPEQVKQPSKPQTLGNVVNPEVKDTVLQSESEPTIQQLSEPASQQPSYQSPYSTQIDSILNNILNRQPFSYDLASDPMYQVYSEQYTQKANQGMRDTMGNAAALTGGYGNTYASAAGQQTYDNYMSELNNVIPDLYNAALSNYQNQISNDYNSLNALQLLENQAYGQYRDSVGDYQTDRAFEYGKERDSVADSQWHDTFEYGQKRDRVDDKKWRESYEYGKERDAVADEQWQDTFEYGKERDSVTDSQWNKSFNYNQSRDAIDDDYRNRNFEYQKERDIQADEEAFINDMAAEELSKNEKQSSESTKRVDKYTKNVEAMFKEKDTREMPIYSVEDVWDYLDGSGLSDEEFAEIVNSNYRLRKYGESLR